MRKAKRSHKRSRASESISSHPLRGGAAGGRPNSAALKASLKAQAALHAIAAKRPGAPGAPKKVDPFLTAADLAQIAQYTGDYKTKVSGIDFDLSNLSADTTFQKTQVDQTAKQNTSSTQDDAAARGIFQSSIKDAALYDVEAQRSLQQKFLDDKLTAATLNAGTQKRILGDQKSAFDKAMQQQQLENAAPINDAQNSAYSDSRAAYDDALKKWQKQYAAAQQNAAAASHRAGLGSGVSRPTAPRPKKPASPHYAGHRSGFSQGGFGRPLRPPRAF